jgi:hypothetical protein
MARTLKASAPTFLETACAGNLSTSVQRPKLALITVKRSVSSCLRSLTACLRVVVCAIVVGMLLFFPANKVHSFRNHFRSPEVRRAIERNTAVAHSAEKTHALVGQMEFLPTFFTPTETNSKVVALENFESAADVPLARLLNRLKLNPAGSSGQDPLLQA